MQTACTLGLAALQARLADKEAAEARATKLETENGALVQRLIQLKATEVERMNEVNRVCEEMVGCRAYSESSVLACVASWSKL